MEILIFALSLVGILIAAELFTNAVENVGDRLGLSHGVVGSLLAAVGTALPETLVPIVALLFGDPHAREEIANGAILGAPFMLATLGFTIVALAALIKKEITVKTDAFLLKRDLSFFLALFTPALLLAFIPGETLKVIYGIALIFGYGYYVYHVIKEGGEELDGAHPLYAHRYLKVPDNLITSIGQLILSLALLVVAVEFFVHAIAALSKHLGISPLVFSLLIAPVATELPEKFNSFFWSLRGKYELAFGNITGAMVFQASVPVAVGLIFTDWQIGFEGALSGVIAIVGALLVLLQVLLWRSVKSPLLLLNGALYALYVLFVLLRL